MTNIYNDELFPDNFEEMARAYAKSLKSKNFVFVNLKQEEFNLLVDEVFVVLSKMKSCLNCLKTHFECKKLQNAIENSQALLSQKFAHKKPHDFKCVVGENYAFLSLFSLENILILKLMSLAIKSEEFELCNGIISSISGIFAQSFSTEGFIPSSLQDIQQQEEGSLP